MGSCSDSHQPLEGSRCLLSVEWKLLFLIKSIRGGVERGHGILFACPETCESYETERKSKNPVLEDMEDLSRCMMEAGQWVKSCCCCGEDDDDEEDKERSEEDEGDDKEEVSLRISRSWTSLPPDEVSLKTLVTQLASVQIINTIKNGKTAWSDVLNCRTTCNSSSQPLAWPVFTSGAPGPEQEECHTARTKDHVRSLDLLLV